VKLLIVRNNGEIQDFSGMFRCAASNHSYSRSATTMGYQFQGSSIGSNQY
jgi:hypothetical protein